MHVACLTWVYIHQDEPWYLKILYVGVTCKVHKSRKPGDNCMRVTCHSSWKGGRYLQESIPLGFHQCQLIAEKDEQIPDLTLLLAPLGLRIKFIRPLSFRRVQAFEMFNYSILRISSIIHERCRPIQKRDLGVFIFTEHIRKLTIDSSAF